MRRLLLLAALAAPALGAAQTVSPGQVLFTEGTNDIAHGKFITADECANARAISLSWSIAVSAGTTFPTAAKATVYASNTESTGADCIKADGGTTSNIKAAPIGETISNVQQTENLRAFTTNAFVTAAGLSCSTTADTPIYVCVQAFQSDGTTPVGLAKGTLTLSTAKPDSPTGLSAVPADTGALQISWTAPTSNTAAFDYRLRTTNLDDNTFQDRTDITAQTFTVTRLQVGTEYRFEVWSRSEAGNESASPATTTATPVAVANFWDVYQAAGGQEQGGCATGGAGSAAFLGLAALLAALRRRS